MASIGFRILVSVTAVLAALAAPARAVPVISETFYFTDRWAPNLLATAPEGDFAHISAFIDSASTPDPISSLDVVATQGSSTVPLSYSAFAAPIYLSSVFDGQIPFAGAPLGSWSITAADGTGTSAPVLTPPITNPQLLPFVTGVTVSNASTTPTVSWTLPDLTGFQLDYAEIRIINASTEVQFFGMDLPTSATSFMVPGGILASGQSYIYRLILGGESARSNAFSGASRVPESMTLTLMLAALASMAGARLLTRSPASR